MSGYFEILAAAKVPAALWPQQPRSAQLRSLETEATRFPPERLAQLYQYVPTPEDVANLQFFQATTAALAACLEAAPAPTPDENQRQLSDAFAAAEKQAPFAGDRNDRDTFRRVAVFCALLVSWDVDSIRRANPDADEEDVTLYLRAARLVTAGANNGT